MLQASTRRKLHARRCREGVAAVVLQSTSRRISAKAVVARAREAKRVEEAAAKRQAEELLAAQTAAVVVLQTRCVRGHQARAMLRTAKAAVLRLQCSHRQRAARRVYEAAWEVHCRSRAALVIQCGYRQYTARQVYATLVAAAWELHSALIVQCGYRQYVARQVYAKHVIAAWEAYNRTAVPPSATGGYERRGCPSGTAAPARAGDGVRLQSSRRVQVSDGEACRGQTETGR